MTEDFKDASEKILREIFPWLVVNYDLDELYEKDPIEAAKIIMQKLDEEQILDQKDVMLVNKDFPLEKEKLVQLIKETNDDHFPDYNEMFLFKAVSLLEAMINIWFNDQLIFKEGITHAKANSILNKLSITDKMDWLLLLLTNNSFIHHPSWIIIKHFIKLRNYFIHFKSNGIDENTKNKESLTKENILKFLDASEDCYSFLMARQSQELINYLKRLRSVSKLFNSRHEDN